jgi:hypothetical protein
MFSSLLSHTFFADICAPGSFFGIPSWWQYLYPTYISQNGDTHVCEFNFQLVSGGKVDFTPIALIGLGILDILLRLAALVAVGYIIYAGIQYVTSQGEPDKTKRALGTLINAAVGLTITIVASAAVSYIGHTLG